MYINARIVSIDRLKPRFSFINNHINKHFEGSCELLSLNMILMLTSC